MTKVIARVHPVHLMNADLTPGGRQPSDQANRLGLPVRRKLAATTHIHHRHSYYYSTHKLILILPFHGGEKAEPTTAVKVRSPCPMLYIAAAVAIKNRPRCDSKLGSLTSQSDALITRLLRPAMQSKDGQVKVIGQQSSSSKYKLCSASYVR